MLYIERVGEAPLTVTLCLHNTSSIDDVLFRIQTTSPTIYRVRPSHGRISAMSSTETQVVMVGEPVKADKFLVKYTTVATDTATGDFLPMFEQAAAKMAMERRLRVVLLGSDGAEVGGIGTGAGTGNAKEDNATLRRDSTSPPSKRADPVKRSDSFASQHSINSTPPVAPHESMESPPAIAGTVMSESALQAELKEARSKIQLLVAKNQELSKALDDAKNLRQRAIDKEQQQHPVTKLDRGISEAELNSLISAQAGFPPVLVILIALFAFLVGLLF